MERECVAAVARHAHRAQVSLSKIKRRCQLTTNDTRHENTDTIRGRLATDCLQLQTSFRLPIVCTHLLAQHQAIQRFEPYQRLLDMSPTPAFGETGDEDFDWAIDIPDDHPMASEASLG